MNQPVNRRLYIRTSSILINKRLLATTSRQSSSTSKSRSRVPLRVTPLAFFGLFMVRVRCLYSYGKNVARTSFQRCTRWKYSSTNFEKNCCWATVVVLFDPSHIIVYPSSRRRVHSTSSASRLVENTHRDQSFSLQDSLDCHLAKIFILASSKRKGQDYKKAVFGENHRPRYNAVSSYIDNDCGVGDKINPGIHSEPTCLSCFWHHCKSVYVVVFDRRSGVDYRQSSIHLCGVFQR